MYQEIPEGKYKKVVISDNLFATGYKSLVPNDTDNNHASLVFESSSFKLNISERKSLLKLKEALDFALEIKEENNK